MWTNWERTVSYEGIHCNQSDQVVLLWIINNISYNNEKLFQHSLCHLSELLSLVTCKQRAVHYTPMTWFDFIRWRFHFIRRLFHYSNYIKYNQNDVIQNCISSETHSWYMYTIWEIEIPNLWSTQMPSQRQMGVERFLLVLAPIFCGTICYHLVVI